MEYEIRNTEYRIWNIAVIALVLILFYQLASSAAIISTASVSGKKQLPYLLTVFSATNSPKKKRNTKQSYKIKMNDKIIRWTKSQKHMFVSLIKTLKMTILNTSFSLHFISGPSLLPPSNTDIVSILSILRNEQATQSCANQNTWYTFTQKSLIYSYIIYFFLSLAHRSEKKRFL